MQKKLLVARRSGNGRWRHRHTIEAGRLCVGGHPSEHGLVDSWIRDEAVLADFVASSFELRLDERDHIGAAAKRRERRKDVSERNERDIDRHDVHLVRDVRWRQGTGVHAFVDVNARVSAQPPVQLAVADIERDHARRAALQQDVGEAPVEAPTSRARLPDGSTPKSSRACASLTPPRLTYG